MLIMNKYMPSDYIKVKIENTEGEMVDIDFDYVCFARGIDFDFPYMGFLSRHNLKDISIKRYPLFGYVYVEVETINGSIYKGKVQL